MFAFVVWIHSYIPFQSHSNVFTFSFRVFFSFLSGDVAGYRDYIVCVCIVYLCGVFCVCTSSVKVSIVNSIS